MKGDPEIIEALNDVLTAELTAINQYYAHYKMCENWGYSKLAAHNRQESIEEMQHADKLIDRVLFFEGIPNMQRYGTVKVGENVVEQHEVALEFELENVARLTKHIQLCLDKNDNGTRLLFEQILKDEEEAVDWIECQLGIIAEIGKENYLAEQL